MCTAQLWASIYPDRLGMGLVLVLMLVVRSFAVVGKTRFYRISTMIVQSLIFKGLNHLKQAITIIELVY